MASRDNRVEQIDPVQYLDPPQVDVPGTLALARAVLDVAPVTPQVDLIIPLRRLRKAVDDLHSTWQLAPQPPPLPREAVRVESKQPVDLIMDNAWTALYERLRAYALLPEEQVPRARRAREILRTLFPDALAFLRLPYEAEWAQSEDRLKSIERLRLGEELATIAGPEFLVEVRRAHELYTRVLGMKGGEPTLSSAGSESAVLRELRWAVGKALSQYATKVLELADEDPFQIKRLLAPIAEYQRTVARKRGDGSLGARSSSHDSRPAGLDSRLSDGKPEPRVPDSKPELRPPAKRGSESAVDWAPLRRISESGDWAPIRVSPDASSASPLTSQSDKPDSEVFPIRRTDSGTYRAYKKPTE